MISQKEKFYKGVLKRDKRKKKQKHEEIFQREVWQY